MVDDAREVTHEQAAAYQATGRKARVPKPSKTAKKSVKKSSPTAPDTTPPKIPTLYIRLQSSEDTALLSRLKAIVDKTVGQNEVILVLGPETAKQAVKLPSRVQANPDIVAELAELVGSDSVKLQ